MKKGILYFLACVGITVCISLIWAFKSPVDQTASYTVVNLYTGSSRFAVSANTDGIAEEMKFEKGISDPQVIIQITSKMEAKGYCLAQYAVSGGTYSFIFKKKS